MAISDQSILNTLTHYLEHHQDETGLLAAPLALLSQGTGFASRHTFPMHVTAGALLVRHAAEVLLISHRAYGNLLLQPGGHLEPDDATLMGAALRELQEETGIDTSNIFPATLDPVYIEYGQVPARPEKDEPAHHHLDFGFAFTTDDATIGRIQESEVTGAAWYPLSVAERLVGSRVPRAVQDRQRRRTQQFSVDHATRGLTPLAWKPQCYSQFDRFFFPTDA